MRLITNSQPGNIAGVVKHVEGGVLLGTSERKVAVSAKARVFNSGSVAALASMLCVGIARTDDVKRGTKVSQAVGEFAAGEIVAVPDSAGYAVSDQRFGIYPRGAWNGRKSNTVVLLRPDASCTLVFRDTQKRNSWRLVTLAEEGVFVQTPREFRDGVKYLPVATFESGEEPVEASGFAV